MGMFVTPCVKICRGFVDKVRFYVGLPFGGSYEGLCYFGVSLTNDVVSLLVLVLSLFGRKLFPFNYLIVAFVGGACETSLAKIMLVLASLGLTGLCVVTFSSS